jgi:hypothetical protein
VNPTTVAYHEAGHAVLAYITGVYMIDGPISTSGSPHAETPIWRDAALCAARTLDMGELDLHEYDYEGAIIAAAGHEAERIYLLRNNLTVDEQALGQGAHGDLCLVRELLGPKHWVDACSAAAQYLHEPKIWKMVEQLATSILRHSGTLTKDQATETLERISIELEIPPLRVLRRV